MQPQVGVEAGREPAGRTPRGRGAAPLHCSAGMGVWNDRGGWWATGGWPGASPMGRARRRRPDVRREPLRARSAIQGDSFADEVERTAPRKSGLSRALRLLIIGVAAREANLLSGPCQINSFFALWVNHLGWCSTGLSWGRENGSWKGSETVMGGPLRTLPGTLPRLGAGPSVDICAAPGGISGDHRCVCLDA